MQTEIEVFKKKISTDCTDNLMNIPQPTLADY